MRSASGRSGRHSIIYTVPGTRRGPFALVDWSLLAGVPAIWGASYLLIDIGLESLEPAVITWVRVIFGCAVLVGIPSARRRIDREDWKHLIALAVVWSIIPFLLGPISQQHITSSMAGMINSLIPIGAAMVSIVLLRSAPNLRQIVGICLGFAGAMGLGLPAVRESPEVSWGVLLALIAVVLYSFSFNLTVPLQQKYGAPAVMMKALAISVVGTAPFGIAGLLHSTWNTASVVAVVVLGILNTGIAFVMVGLLVGRVGATRGSVVVYFLPVAAITLGVLFRNETVLPIQIAGTGLVLVGAFLISRGEK